LHALDYHLVLGFVGFFLDWDNFLGEDCLSDLFVDRLLRDVFLDRVERVLIGNVDACVSLGLGGLHTYLNS
jgi:hypothetical protein